jgi:diguanylate cyclase (GGDEF)-like protein
MRGEVESGSERGLVQELRWIAQVSQALARSTYGEDARRTICEVARSATGADAVVLLEPGPDARMLLPSAVEGIAIGDAALPADDGSTPATAMRLNSPRLTPDTAAEPGEPGRLLAAAGLGSAWWQPISRGRTVRGVLMFGWRSPQAEIDPGARRLAEVISVEAAVALDRGTALERLTQMARIEPLTGLPNRRAWEHELEREIARAARQGSPLAVAMLYLNGFKAHNDTHGHAAGDRILRAAAAAWLPLVRATDTLARYGGDEFAISLPDCPIDQAQSLMERLASAVESLIGFSSGVALWNGTETAHELVRRADEALYEAKSAGRTVVVARG